MQTSRKISTVFAWGLLGVLFSLLSNDALSQVRKVSIKELTLESTAIVVGKCIKRESFWNDKRTQILTEVRIQTGESIKGSPGSEVVITIPGGRVGNTIYEVSDMPVFVEGEEVLVFLWRHPSGKNLVTGALPGKLTIVEDKKTGKKMLRGESIMLNEEKNLTKKATPRTTALKKMFHEDFITEVKGYVKE